MLYAGVDIHLKWWAVCVLNESGQRVLHKRVRDRADLIRSLTELGDQLSICFEASCGYGYYHELFSRIAERVVVAHPGHLRLIFRSKRKRDSLDAEKLAKLLLLDAVPTVHVPSAHMRAWRELIVFRQRLVHKRTRAKNAARALVRHQGISIPTRPGLWTRRGLAWLRGLEFTQSAQALQRDLLVDEIETLSRQICRVERELGTYSQRHPGIALLRTIPGVGLRTAEAIVAFVDDPRRFQHSKEIGAYFGWVPCQDQSGDRNRLGHITRDGSPVVRQLLTEAVWQGIRRSPTIRAYFERMQRDDPQRKKIALVATAHYLSRVMWSMLLHNRVWEERGMATAA
jgi:transposase